MQEKLNAVLLLAGHTTVRFMQHGLIEACGIVSSESVEAHDKIAKCLHNSQHVELATAGLKPELASC